MTGVLPSSRGRSLFRALAAGLFLAGACTRDESDPNGPSTPAFDVSAASVIGVEVSPTAVALAPFQTQIFTAKARLSDGSTVNASVTWSATGGTISSTGVYQASGLLGTHKVIARRKEGPEADTALVTISGSATPQATLLAKDDFSTYTSTANLLADPRDIYHGSEDINPGWIVLDQTVGYGGSTKSMRYDFPGGSCHGRTISRGVKVPNKAKEVWLEIVARFSSSFSTIYSGCVGVASPAHKFVFGLLPGGGGRFDAVDGIFGWRWDGHVPGYSTTFVGIKSPFGSGFDGQWHTYRFHWKVSSTPTTPDGAYEMWMDGVKVVNNLQLKTSSNGYPNYFYIIALGRNFNQGPKNPQSLWWGRVQLFSGNPGW